MQETGLATKKKLFDIAQFTIAAVASRVSHLDFSSVYALIKKIT